MGLLISMPLPEKWRGIAAAIALAPGAALLIFNR